MKYVLFYDFGADANADAVIGEHMAAHRARWEECQARGTLLAIGPFTDRAGALSVFTTREAAVEYALVGQGMARGAAGRSGRALAVAPVALAVADPEEGQYRDYQPDAVDVPQHRSGHDDDDHERQDRRQLADGVPAQLPLLPPGLAPLVPEQQPLALELDLQKLALQPPLAAAGNRRAVGGRRSFRQVAEQSEEVCPGRGPHGPVEAKVEFGLVQPAIAVMPGQPVRYGGAVCVRDAQAGVGPASPAWSGGSAGLRRIGWRTHLDKAPPGQLCQPCMLSVTSAAIDCSAPSSGMSSQLAR
jgi:uncharacterized protein YciI